MSAEVTVTIAGVRRKVAPGVRLFELLNQLPRDNGKPNYLAARVNGKLYDLSRTIDVDAEVEPLAAESAEGLDVLRHSAAHLMAQAVQSLYPETQVTIGPTIEDGFYYDFAPPKPFTLDDLPKIEAKMRELAKADLKVERVEMTRGEAIKLFAAM